MRFATCSLLVLTAVLKITAQTNAPATTAPPEHHETVIVTGQWEPVPLDESDRSVSEYPVQDQVLLFGGFDDVLAQDPSVYIQPRGANGIQSDISIRGASFEQTLFLLDGIRLNDEQSAHYNSDLPIPMDAIQRVEILQGAGSTLYGSDATGGVVNFITRPVTNDGDALEMRLRADYGSFNTNEESGFLAAIFGPVSQRMAFERELSDGFADDREYRNLAFSVDTWVKSPLGLTRVFTGYDDRPFGANQFYGDFNSWERTKTWLATLSQDLGKDTLLTLGFRRHADLFELLRDDPGFYTNRHIDDAWDGAIRRHDSFRSWATLSYGVEVTADHVHSNNLGIHTREQEALYAALDARTLRRASLTAGVREEFYEGGHAIFVPNVSGGYWLSDRVKLRASASRGFRLPSYTDVYYSDPANVGNPHLKPERAQNYEGGADWHIGARIKLAATVFDRRETDDIDYVRANSSEIWQAMNFDRVSFVGGDAEFSTSLPHNQTLAAGYTVLHGAQAALNGLQSKYVFNYPTQQAVVSWERLVNGGLTARVRSGVTKQYERSAYVLVDASVAWTRSRFHAYLRATNLANVDYQPVLGVTMPGRALTGGVEFVLFGSDGRQP